MPTDSTSYGAVISGNIVALRARARMKQSSLAARMRALGHPWYPQTVGEIENGRRRVTAEEILGLALALGTTAINLLTPGPDDPLVQLLSGDELPASSVIRVIISGGMSPGLRPVVWSDDDKPDFRPEIRAQAYDDWVRQHVKEDDLP
jgi:transcriptional regulator with XRE-family HTH domain